MDKPYCLVLVHSPLVGPFTWSLVAQRLRDLNIDVLVPELVERAGTRDPYWKQHAGSAAKFIDVSSPRVPVVLVAHSGAGPLLPAIRGLTEVQVGSYLFVDAGLPIDAYSRLDLIANESPEGAEEFRQDLEEGRLFPNWTEDELREDLPDREVRSGLLAEIHPRGLDFFNEKIPVFHGWPDLPCGYILFSKTYQPLYLEAKRNGWVVAKIRASHFHMLVDPGLIVELILQTVAKL